ncbi:MAG: AgmX/PglI C-terminal domain-containing protein [Polyangiaceae bacterium]|nr:AgmX/PglI C-terminal domain-containing protein [Polyangiaceae bacterium]
MRTCATASIVAILGIPLVVTFAACASGSQSEGTTTPDKTATETKKDEPAEVRKDEPKTDMPSQTAAPEAKADAPKRTEPTTTAECAQIPAEAVTDGADAGVVMNNAQTAADAGKSDRFTPVNDIIKSRRKAFRCCFDIWAKTHPGQPGQVKFAFELAPDGSLKSAAAKKEESSPMATEIEPCMVEVIKTITFPKSPSGRDTRFTYPFDFKAR